MPLAWLAVVRAQACRAELGAGCLAAWPAFCLAGCLAGCAACRPGPRPRPSRQQAPGLAGTGRAGPGKAVAVWPCCGRVCIQVPSPRNRGGQGPRGQAEVRERGLVMDVEARRGLGQPANPSRLGVASRIIAAAVRGRSLQCCTALLGSGRPPAGTWGWWLCWQGWQGWQPLLDCQGRPRSQPSFLVNGGPLTIQFCLGVRTGRIPEPRAAHRAPGRLAQRTERSIAFSRTSVLGRSFTRQPSGDQCL